jgi:hypothetical protein
MTAKRRVPLGKRARRAAMTEAIKREEYKSAKRGRAIERETYNQRLAAGVDRAALDEAMNRVLAEAQAATDQPRRRRSRGAAPMAFPADAAGRWVPIGPSVVRRGQAMDRPRVTGRIRDLAVDPTGTRAYAASAMGGVWYTADGGSTWSPVGGWAERRRVAGGSSNGQATGCLLVSFGATAELDVVLVGTGETTPSQAPMGEGASGGVGVLSDTGPVSAAVAGDPWEADSGLDLMEGLGVFRIVRSPTSTAGLAVGGAQDKVVACTSNGAFIGTRKHLAAGSGLPSRDGFEWVRMTNLSTAHPNAGVSDAVWLPGGRLVLAVMGTGLVWTDDLGVTLHNIASTQAPTVTITGVMSLAVAQGNRIYLLGETGGLPTLWQIPNATLATPVATSIPALPATLWPNQRDYDQAIAVDVVAGVDRVYIAGSAVLVRAGGDYGASMYCYDVIPTPPPVVPPIPPFSLTAANGIARTGVPPGGDGADKAGLIGNNVHGDVHAIRLTGAVSPRRQVWVATDGGVFVSDRSGRVQTFASMNNGIAALQPVFVRAHPVNGHVIGAGFQDNGTQIRTGDTVWDELYEGDGGGLAFHPTSPHLMVRQYVQSQWSCTSSAAYVDPMTRNHGWPNGGVAIGSEDGWSSFYSGATTVRVPPSGLNPARGRLALGTYRVWLTDDLGVGAGPNTWQTLPFPGGVTADGRPGANGAATAASLQIGLPNPWGGPIITMAWASTTELLVVYRDAIVRYTESPPGTWGTKMWRLNDHHVAMPRNTILTDLTPVPGARNFYVATTGVVGSAEETVWFYSPSDDQFHRTGLRHVLDTAGPPAVTGPRDPAYAVVLDPTDPTIVYIGTTTGVWRGHRTTATGTHTWTPFVNGLPQSTVQDLDIWVDPAGGAGSLRLLRAGVQSRGVWEVDLAHDAARRTWIRAHAWDDRRMPLSANLNPLQAPPVAPEPFTASPDIVVRPRWTRSTAPSFVAAPQITTITAPTYEVWTFQTAFRWLYPSVAATGVFTEAMANLISFHRTTMGKTAVPVIDQAVWDAVVGGVRVKPNGVVSADIADPRAVYRAPWHTSRAPAALPAEIDFTELVVPPRSVGNVWSVYRETSTVDVLVHHRDSREVPADGAYVVLMWRAATTPAALMALSPTTVATYLTAIAGGTAAVIPGGWNVAAGSGAVARRTVSVPVDGRMPRGTSIDVDLSAVPAGQHVLFLAFVGSTADDLPLSLPAINPLTSITDLVRSWPYAAARVVLVNDRPV